MNPYRDVREFHERFEQPICEKPIFPDKHRRSLRLTLMQEEFREYMQAEFNDDFVEVADALVDMIYIICGTALEYGIPLDECWKAVHAANMTKLGPDGRPLKRADGKVIKPDGWKPVNLGEVMGL